MVARPLMLLFCTLLMFPPSMAGDEYPQCANGRDGTLWMQTSAEWIMNCRQAWITAQFQLDRALADKTWTAALEQDGDFSQKPPAVVVDVDETVLDNSPFQATMMKQGKAFDPQIWDQWILARSATAIPGAVAFLQYAHSRGVTIFYVTNRSCNVLNNPEDPCPQETATMENLKNLGFPDVSPDHLLLKKEQPDWTSEKMSRRVKIAADYRILLLCGDNLGDFMPGVRVEVGKRGQLAREHEAWWGERWIVLANPLYGYWLTALGDDPVSHLKSFR